jgi:itaconate CoA-transferase
MLPLAGVKVVSVEHAVAAPFATRQLADLGARVIKVERPGSGDFARHYDGTVRGESSYFVWLNRGKESMTLDIQAAAGRAVLHRMLADSDVFVQNLGPGSARRLQLDAESLRDRYPRLIPCTISGYGTTGPWANRKAYDLLVQSEAGLVALTGTPDAVAKVAISVADIAAGMYAYSGVLAALLRRATSGEVSAVEVSLFEALAEWMSQPANYARYGGSVPERMGAQHATIAPYGPYPTADGSVVLAVQNEREWLALCEQVLKVPELSRDERFARNTSRVANRHDLNSAITAVLSRMDTDTAVALLDSASIAYARLNTVMDFVEHPVLRGRGRWSEVRTPHGAIEALRPPVDFSDVSPVMGALPALGEHTRAILRELGMSEHGIERLGADAVI